MSVPHEIRCMWSAQFLDEDGAESSPEVRDEIRCKQEADFVIIYEPPKFSCEHPGRRPARQMYCRVHAMKKFRDIGNEKYRDCHFDCNEDRQALIDVLISVERL